MNYLLAYHTETGRRAANQDSLLVQRAVCNGEQVVLASVCDGMGGLKKGEVASAALVRRFSEWFTQELPKIAVNPSIESEILNSWDDMVKKMNRKILAYGRRKRIEAGTTVTAMLFIRDRYYIVHVGDSRAYELTEQAVLLTKDQTLAAREAERGRLTWEQAERDARKNILLQCVGASNDLKPAYISGNVKRNAVYLLCSDGFCHEIGLREIKKAFRPEEMSDESVLTERCRQLTRKNLERGEQDNISVIAVRTW